MDVKAKIRPGYIWRPGLIALALLGFAGYFFYDGAIAYPYKQNIQLAYQQLQEEYPESSNERWIQMATENGWDTAIPSAPMSDMSITTQFICGFICLPIGIYFAFGFLSALRWWVAMDDNGLKDHRGRDIPWEAIESVDTSRWKTKGIAWVHFKNNDQSDKLLLDDWKFETKPIGDIMKELENRSLANISLETDTLEAGSDHPIDEPDPAERPTTTSQSDPTT
ncbi:MAG: hypothetical protein AAF823_16130 [Planctomycetota bacterium]